MLFLRVYLYDSVQRGPIRLFWSVSNPSLQAVDVRKNIHVEYIYILGDIRPIHKGDSR